MAIEEIDPQEAKRRQDDGWTYVDVRTPEEFAAGHPAGAVNIPVAFLQGGSMVANPDFLARMKQFPADRSLLMGCKSGGRSMRAAQMLEASGYSSLANVVGGFHGSAVQRGWKDLGLPVE